MLSVKNRKVLFYICFLQFIGPIFVILGHSLNGISNQGIWYIFTREWIYIFHMPLFFFISGYLLAYNGWTSNKDYSSFIKIKVKRLLLPYFFWNIVFFIPKYLVQGYLSDDISISLSYITKIFFSPRLNVWGHTWFLVCLFILFIFTPVWKWIFDDKNKIKYAIFLIIGIVLYILPINTMLFCLNDLHKEILFFGIGCIIGKSDFSKLKINYQKYWIIYLLMAIISSIFCLKYYSLLFIHFIPCFFIVYTLFGIPLKFNLHSKIVEKFSGYSFGIYIMHWPIMIGTRILLYQLLDLNVYLCVMLMIVLGWIIPIVVIEFLRKIKNKKIKNILQYLLGV